MGLALAAIGACTSPTYQCSDDGQCPEGLCVDASCAFPDETCDSGYRFGQYSVPHLAGRCVSPAADASTSTSTTSSTTEVPQGTTSVPPLDSSEASTAAVVAESSSSSSSSSSSATGETQDPDLLAYYPCDDDPVSDASGNGFDGACTSCPTLATGLLGGACLFDGTNRVTVPYDAAFELEALTLAAWVDVTLPPPDQLLSIAGVPVGDGTANAYQFGVNAVGGGSRLFTCFGTELDQFCLNSPIVLEGWMHLATTIGPEGAANYVDGVLVGQADPIALGYDMRDLLFGADIDDGTQMHTFVGHLDELRIYARALEPEEIAALAVPP